MPTMTKDTFIPALIIGMVALLGNVSAAESPSGISQTGRFAVLETFREEAVLDRTTQLIWERTPNLSEVTWPTAQTRCQLKTVGGQTGWRLPSFIELMTLIEPPLHHTSSLPALPAGHPFHGVKATPYWTGDASSSEPATAYTVDLLRADVAPRQKTQSHPLWCVKEGIPDQTRPAENMSQPGLI